nr:universal stress protein [uncultured Dongia sp.]
MSRSVILAVVMGTPSDADVLNAAESLSQVYDSHIEVLHPRLDPYRVLAGLVDSIGSLGTSDIIVGLKQDIDRRTTLARNAFSAWIARSDAIVDPQLSSGAASLANGTITSWREYEGTYDSALTQYGRLADLIVVAQPASGSNQSQDTVVEAAIFVTGRPVLCVPHGFETLDMKHMAIMWNGSLQAARAVGDAMPLLSACTDAVVLTAGVIDGPGATDLVERLVLRGIDARTRRIPASPDAAPTALLKILSEIQCGIAVMGGYGHSRLRELLLGGVTRQMLADAKIPLLLAH